MAIDPNESVVVLCDRVKREEGTKKATLDGLFDRVMTKGLPAGVNGALYFRFYPSLTLGSPISVRLLLARPNGVTDQFPEMKMAVGTDGRCEGQISLENFPVRELGQHHFVVMAGSEEVGRARFVVAHIGAAAPQGGSGGSSQEAN